MNSDLAALVMYQDTESAKFGSNPMIGAGVYFLARKISPWPAKNPSEKQPKLL